MPQRPYFGNGEPPTRTSFRTRTKTQIARAQETTDVANDKRTPLMNTVINRDTQALADLIEQKANINQATTLSGITATMLAAANGNLHAVQVLVQAGANLDARDRVGLTARDYAHRTGHAEVVQWLDALAQKRLGRRQSFVAASLAKATTVKEAAAEADHAPTSLHAHLEQKRSRKPGLKL